MAGGRVDRFAVVVGRVVEAHVDDLAGFCGGVDAVEGERLVGGRAVRVAERDEGGRVAIGCALGLVQGEGVASRVVCGVLLLDV